MACPDVALKLPEWYIIERKTEKTIEKLTTIKELDYYLNNPNGFIRRQAIIRLSMLNLKDSGNRLLEITEDTLESEENKNLAAWAIKTVHAKSNSEILFNNRYLTRYTGYEKLNDLYPFSYEDMLPEIRYEFSSAPLFMQLNASQDELTGIRNFNSESSFEINQWLAAVLGKLGTNIKKGTVRFAEYLLKIPKYLHNFFLIKLPMYLKNSAVKVSAKRKEVKADTDDISIRKLKTTQSYESYIGSGNVYYRGKQREVLNMDYLDVLISKTRTGREKTLHSDPISVTASFLKKVVFYLLYVIFTPIRLFLKHKFAVLIILAGLYIFLNFTSPGRILFINYFGKDFHEVQQSAANSIKQKTIEVWEDFKSFVPIDKLTKNTEGTDTKKEAPVAKTSEQYTVTASKGLNIRIGPGLDTEKVQGGPLQYGSNVSYLGKQSKDSSGILWYYIKASDGRSGWASKKFLKRMDG